ncbi:MAG: LysM peptidoglycan-binding domain-containing protein [Planktomarina sp.]
MAQDRDRKRILWVILILFISILVGVSVWWASQHSSTRVDVPVADPVLLDAETTTLTEITDDASEPQILQQPETVDVSPAAPTGGADASATDLPTVPAPAFDLVRVEKDGSALIAGTAQGVGHVILNLDGVQLSSARADLNGSGQFVIFATLPPKSEPQVLRLQLFPEGGDAYVLSTEKVFLTARAVVEAPIASQAPAVDQTVLAADAPDVPNVTMQVDEPMNPTVLLADDDGVRVLQAGGDEPPLATVALDTISYDPGGDVQLGGRATGGGFVRVYLDNSPITTSRIQDGGFWSTDLPEVVTGVYTLRVDEVTADGEVTSRIETPFKLEDPDRLADLMGVTPNTSVDDPEPTQTDASPTPAAPTVNNEGSVQTVAQPSGSQTDIPTIEPSTLAEVEDPVAVDNPTPPNLVFTVKTVQPGATLWAIAEERYGDGTQFLKVFEANKDRIRDPNLIYPGQVFEVPE